MNGGMFEEFLQKTKIEYPYVGKFIEDCLPTYFNDYYTLLITSEHKKEMEQLPEYVEYKETMLADSIISRHFREKVGNPRLILTLYDWDTNCVPEFLCHTTRIISIRRTPVLP
jgi:hypothetical protein